MEPVTPIDVVIADDHTVVRQGLHALLAAQPDIRVVGEAGDGIEALRLAQERLPTVVLMDISMPGMDGMQTTRAIKQSVPQVQVLVLTMHENEEYFFQVLHAGASGYVLKRAAASDLLTAIRTVAHGEVFLYPTVAKKLLADYLAHVEVSEAPDREGPLSHLTPREREVLALIAQGLSNREIADRLVLGLSTVQTHHSHILEKLGLRNRAELIKYAVRHGLIA